jgi:hypothetical protein
VEAGELALRYRETVPLEGVLLDGTPGSATVSVVRFPALITLKGLALGGQAEKRPDAKYQKHAYDIACVLYACGPSRVADDIREALEHEDERGEQQIRRALANVAEAFRSREAGGARAAAVVWAQGDPDAIALYQTQAFEAVADFLEVLGHEVTR